MGFLTRILSGESMEAVGTSELDPWDDRLYPSSGMMSSAGEFISPERALTLSAVHAATRILAEGIAALPCIVYKRLPNGGKERAPNHPLYELLHNQPNGWQTALEFWEMMMGHLVLRGNAYAQIIPGKRGPVDQLIPRHPDRMRVETIQAADGSVRLRYIWTPPMGPPVTLTQDEVFHLRGMSSDGILGLSVIDAARNSLGLALAAESYGAQFFRKGAKAAGIFTHPNTMKEAAQKNFKASIEAQARDPHSIMVVEEGMTWTQMGMKVEDAQLVQLLNWSVHDVARYWNVSLHLLRELVTPTYASIEMFDLEHVIHTLRPWAVRIEQAIRRDLIVGYETYFVEFLFDALMRGDSAARAAFYNSGIMTGWLTPNEARVKENLNPIEGLDETWRPLNMSKASDPPPAEQSQVPNRSSALASAAAERVLRRELGAVQKALKTCAGDGAKYTAWANTFYLEHAETVAEALAISPLLAGQYCATRQPGSFLRTAITDADRDALVALALQEDERAA